MIEEEGQKQPETEWFGLRHELEEWMAEFEVERPEPVVEEQEQLELLPRVARREEDVVLGRRRRRT